MPVELIEVTSSPKAHEGRGLQYEQNTMMVVQVMKIAHAMMVVQVMKIAHALIVMQVRHEDRTRPERPSRRS